MPSARAALAVIGIALAILVPTVVVSNSQLLGISTGAGGAKTATPRPTASGSPSLPKNATASLHFSTPQIQYHRGDVVIVSGGALNNTTVRIQLWEGSALLFSNTTQARLNGAFLFGLRINESWGFGTKMLLVTDMMTSQFAFSQIDIVASAEDSARIELIAAQWFWNTVLLMGVYFLILSSMAILIMGGYAEYRTKRLTLHQTLGRFGGRLEALSDRWWWQLTTFLQPDGNYLEYTDSGHNAFYTRKATRMKLLAEKDIEHAEWLMEDAKNRKERAAHEIEDFEAQYAKYVEGLKKPAFGGR